jgi:catechol 2,3-dioxygenase
MPTDAHPSTPPEANLEHEVFLSLARLTSDLSADLAELFAGAGITWTQFNALRILRGAGGRALSCGAIGERMIARDADVTRLLDRLERQGLVRRARDEADRRVVTARPTERGLALLAELDEPVQRAHRAQFAHVDEAKLRQLLELLSEVAARPVHRGAPMADVRTASATPGTYRAPAATRLGPVRLQVADLERSLAWYGRVLGLRVVERAASAASLGPRPAQQASAPVLIELVERPGAAPVPAGGRLGLYHVTLLLPERAALGAFLRHLAALGARAGAADHLVSEAIYLQDPDGLGFEVYADRPRDQWRVQHGELVMDSLALDAAGLVRAACDRAWDGVPAGTVVGHVHLHVGDLDAAERFYRTGLGLDLMVGRFPGARFLAAGGYHHHVGLNTWSTGGPAAEGDARLLDWTVVLPTPADVAAAADGLRAAGHAVVLADGAIRAADPWGTVVRVVAEGGAGG